MVARNMLRLADDGVPEIAASGIKSFDYKGAVYILFLTAEGSVKHHVEISADSGMEVHATAST